MKTKALIILAIALSTLSAGATSAVVAVESRSGLPVIPNRPISTAPGLTKNFVGQDNQKIELGPGSSAEFDVDGSFRLLRGSAVLESAKSAKVQTANAVVSYSGKVLLSYDYRERSTSTFVVNGSASLGNPVQGNSDLQLSRNQGSTLVSGDFYPNMLRGLDFTKVNAWLERYGWNEEQRKDLTKGVPNEGLARKIASVENDAAPEQRATQRELESFFPVSQQEAGPAKYEKEFTSSALRGQSHSGVEDAIMKGEEIQFLSPEQAAAIVLPDMGLDSGIRLEMEREDRRKSRLKLPTRLPASLKKVGSFHSKPEQKSAPASVAPTQPSTAPSVSEDPVERALNRLKEIENNGPQASSRPVAPNTSAQLDQNF